MQLLLQTGLIAKNADCGRNSQITVSCEETIMIIGQLAATDVIAVAVELVTDMIFAVAAASVSRSEESWWRGRLQKVVGFHLGEVELNFVVFVKEVQNILRHFPP